MENTQNEVHDKENSERRNSNTEYLPTKCRITKPPPPKPAANPLQFIKVTPPSSLYRKAQEQIKKVEETKIARQEVREEAEDWQANLDNWKSSRRKQHEHIIERVIEVKKLEQEDANERSRRRNKTFSEMIEDRSKGRHKFNIPVYDDDSNDLSDYGIGSSSSKANSVKDVDTDDSISILDEKDHHGYEPSHHRDNSGALHQSQSDDESHPKSLENNNFINSRSQPTDYKYELSESESYSTSIYPNLSSKQPYILRSSSGSFDSKFSSSSEIKDDTEKYTYEGAIQDYRSRLKSRINLDDSFFKRVEEVAKSKENAEVQSLLPKGNLFKRKELFERKEVFESQKSVDANQNDTSAPRRFSEDFANAQSIKERLKSLEKCVDQAIAADKNGSQVGSVKSRVKSFDNTNDNDPKTYNSSTKKDGKSLTNGKKSISRYLMQESNSNSSHEMNKSNWKPKDISSDRSSSPEADLYMDKLNMINQDFDNLMYGRLPRSTDSNLDYIRNSHYTASSSSTELMAISSDREDSGIHTADVSCSVSQADEPFDDADISSNTIPNCIEKLNQETENGKNKIHEREQSPQYPASLSEEKCEEENCPYSSGVDTTKEKVDEKYLLRDVSGVTEQFLVDCRNDSMQNGDGSKSFEVNNFSMDNSNMGNSNMVNSNMANSNMANSNMVNSNMANSNMGCGGRGTADMCVKARDNPGLNSAQIGNTAAGSATIINTTISSPTTSNQSISNQSISNQSISNSSISNSIISNPSISNPSISNPSMSNPSIINPSIINPSVINPTISNATITKTSKINMTINNTTCCVGPNKSMANSEPNSKAFMEDLESKPMDFEKKSSEFESKPFEKQPFENRPFKNQPFEKPFENQPFRNQPFESQPFERQLFENIPFENKPFENQPFENQPFDNKPFENQPFENKPFENKPFENQPFENQPFGNKPFETKPFESKPSNQPFENKSSPADNEKEPPRIYENVVLPSQKPVYENVVIRSNKPDFQSDFLSDDILAPSKMIEPPKVKPPPPPPSDTNETELPPSETSIKRLNSTKRIKKEIQIKRSSFLGLEEPVSLIDPDLTVEKPPDVDLFLRQESKLEKSLYKKLQSNREGGLSEVDSQDSGLEVDRGRLSSDTWCSSFVDSGTPIIHARQDSEQTNSYTSEEEEIMKKEREIIEMIEKEEKSRDGHYTRPAYKKKGSFAPANKHFVANSAYESNLGSEEFNRPFIPPHPSCREVLDDRDSEVLKVEHELLQLEREELERQQENMLFRENQLRRQNRYSMENICSPPYPPYNDYRKSMPELQHIPQDLRKPEVPSYRLPPPTGISYHKSMPDIQHAYSSSMTEYRNVVPGNTLMKIEHQKSMPDLDHDLSPPVFRPPPSLRLPIMPGKPIRPYNKDQRDKKMMKPIDTNVLQQNIKRRPISAHNIHTLSAAPKPRPIANDTWIQPKAKPEAKNYNQHWLYQEAELRRLSEKNKNWPASRGGSDKHLPDSVIQSLTQRVQSRVVLNDRNPHVRDVRSDGSPSKELGPHPYLNHPQTMGHALPMACPPHVENQDKMLSVSGKKKCSYCNNELGRGAAMIIESLCLFYHMECFKCCVCHMQLGDGLMGTDVRVRNQKLHCHNCYSSDDGVKFSCV